MGGTETAAAEDFDRFTADAGERLRRVLVAHHGVEVGNDVTDEALAYAWEHWERVSAMDNPIGYLYRVGQSATRRHVRWGRRLTLPVETRVPEEPGDPGLHTALARLKQSQRVCVVLVHVYDWTYEQTAAALGISAAAVRNHLHRGLRQLRHELEDQK
jgi:RNA polymerase sigma-70 factor (ECF subfamily)